MIDWKKLGDTTARFIRAAKALGNDAMAKVEKKVADPATEIGMALEKITADQSKIARQAIELAANSIQLQNKQKQLLQDIHTTNERIAVLLRTGNRDQATTLAYTLQKQQDELRVVANRLLQATDDAKDIAMARDVALFELERRRQELLDLQAKQPAIAAMEGITAVLQKAQALSPDVGTALAQIDNLAAMTETDVCQGMDQAIAEADADAIIRRFEAEQVLNQPAQPADPVEPPVIKTLGRESRKGVTLIEMMVYIAIIGVIAAVVVGAFTVRKSTTNGGNNSSTESTSDNSTAINAMEAMGFTDVTVTSVSNGFGECGGEVLSYVYHVAATNPAGQRVTNAIVCSELFKGATVRFNKK